MSEADNGPDGYTDYAIPVEGGGTTLSLPQGMSGRVYLAIGQKLKFRCNPGNALAYPAGWVSSDPNYPILHDCAEFTYDGAGMHCNTTMVDMLSVPLAILAPIGIHLIFAKVLRVPLPIGLIPMPW